MTSPNERSLCMQLEVYLWTQLTPEKGIFGGVGNKVGAVSWLYVMFPFRIVSEIQGGE